MDALLAGWERRRVPRGDGTLTVAMFHRTLDARLFAEQLEALLRDRRPVTGAQVLSSLHGEQTLPAGAVWLTFDDAYGDFADLAWPVLQRMGLTATQFVPTAYVGTNPAAFWWERLAAAFRHADAGDRLTAKSAAALKQARNHIKSLPHALAMEEVDAWMRRLGATNPRSTSRVLTWQELRDLQTHGLELAGHTRTHPMLDQVDHQLALEEIAGGLQDLREQGLQPLPILAYPSGQYNEAVMRAAKQAGVQMGLTVENGINRTDRWDPFRVLRVPIGPYADRAAVRLRLLLAGRPQ